MQVNSLLGPVVALVAWTTLLRIWHAVKRRGATSRDRILRGATSADTEQNLYRPALFEQPVRFYAIVFALIFMGFNEPINAWIAWTYVGLRVARDLVEETLNHLRTRFFLFLGATICLVALIIHAAIFLILHG